MIVFSEHSIDRFRERAEPTLGRDAARALLERLRLDRTGIFSADGKEQVLLEGYDLVGVLDEARATIVTIKPVHPERLLALRAAAYGRKKSREVSA